MKLNEIYDDTVVKYTLNITRPLYLRLCRHCSKGTKYGGRKSVYIRELLERDLIYETRFADDPPRKYSGFVSGLLRNSFRLRWFNNKLDSRRRL